MCVRVCVCVVKIRTFKEVIFLKPKIEHGFACARQRLKIPFFFSAPPRPSDDLWLFLCDGETRLGLGEKDLGRVKHHCFGKSICECVKYTRIEPKGGGGGNDGILEHKVDKQMNCIVLGGITLPCCNA